MKFIILSENFQIMSVIYRLILIFSHIELLHEISGLNKIIYELKKIKLLELPDGQKIISVISKKQKRYFKSF